MQEVIYFDQSNHYACLVCIPLALSCIFIVFCNRSSDYHLFITFDEYLRVDVLHRVSDSSTAPRIDLRGRRVVAHYMHFLEK